MPIHEEDNNKKQNKGPRGPVVKEFEWFEMETRVRRIIQEIIDPIQHQIVKNSSNIEKLEKNNTSFHDRIQYIMRMTTNDPQVFEKGVFKRIEDKFETQQKTLTFLSEQVRNNTTFIDNKITLIDERMKQSNDMISQIEQLKASNRQNLRHQTEKFDTIRKNIQENVQNMSRAIEENQKIAREKNQKLEKEIALNTMKMQHISKKFNKVKQYFQTQKSINDDLIAQGIKLKEESRQSEVKIGQIGKKLKELNKLKPFLQDIQTDYRKFLFKVDNIIPLINEAQINESLYKILPVKFHPRIAVYQFERYIELNQKVLTRNFQQNVTGINFNGQQLIRESQQRNTRLLTKLKLKYYKNNGVDLDFISFEERERLMNDFDYLKLCEIVDELEEMENEKNDKRKNYKLTEEDIVKLVQREVQTEKEQLINKIHLEIKDSKVYLQKSSEETHKSLQMLQAKIHQLSLTSDSHKAVYEMGIKLFENKQQQLSSNLEINSLKFRALHQINRNVSVYLEKNFEMAKRLELIQKNTENCSKQPHGVSVHKKNSFQHKENNLKSKLGVMIMSDSESNYDSSKIIHEKDDSNHPIPSQTQQETYRMIQSIKKSVVELSVLNQEDSKPSTNKILKSSFSKLTRPSESGDIKYRSQSTFGPIRKQSHLNLSNNSIQIQRTPQKSKEKGLLNIPEFKNSLGTKFCRQAYTSRLSTSRKPSLTPTRAQFSREEQSQNFRQTNNIKNNQVRNSLSYFSELKKQNSRYLN